MTGLIRVRLLTCLVFAALPSLVLAEGYAGEDQPGRPIILISVDTLRAERLSCYGYKELRTSHIDALPKGGTLFGQINSQVPLTLPSHVSFLSSTHPFFNGSEDNSEMVGPNLITLPMMLQSRGYRTAAFVGGFILDKRFGLDRGFDFYDSPFDLDRRQGAEATDLKRPAEEVTHAAMQWLDKNSGRPFFLFLHLFDLHTPYQVPPAFRARFPGRSYDVALSYVDDVLGKFSAFLAQKGLWDKSLIVFLSDHGEGLGDHGESTHGYFIYQSTLHVPLIIRWPTGAGSYPERVDESASLLDIAPTLLQFLNIPKPGQFQGRSLLDMLGTKRPESQRESYSESVYARNHFGCSPLRSLRVGRYKYVDAPKPEFYDLSSDPNELSNLYTKHRALAVSFRDRLQSLRARFSDSRQPVPKVIDPELVERLASLGYLAASSVRTTPSNSGVDPKDRIADYARYRRGVSLALSGSMVEAAALLESVLAKAPDLPDVWNFLGMTQQKSGQHEKAIVSFRQALKKDPLRVLAHFNLAASYFHLKKLDEATRELEVVLKIASSSGSAMDQVAIPARELLGLIYIEKRDYERARTEFAQLLKVAPHAFAAHYNLGWQAAREGQIEQAVRHLRAAVEADPNSAEARNALGRLYLDQSNFRAAQAELSEAIRLNPAFAWAHFNLGLLFSQTGTKKQAADAFRKALEADPQLQVARDALARLGERSQ
ncbi:MAG: sulfatase [Acidobacteria bacterium]|nr:MAG: sulfatase [Acidobacteriota bacterium]